jgi:hypothetical protein
MEEHDHDKAEGRNDYGFPSRKPAFRRFHPHKLLSQVAIEAVELDPATMKMPSVEKEGDVIDAVMRTFEATIYGRRLMDRTFTREITFGPFTFLDWFLRRRIHEKVEVIVHIDEVLKDAPNLSRGKDGQPISVAIMDTQASDRTRIVDVFGREKKVE